MTYTNDYFSGQYRICDMYKNKHTFTNIVHETVIIATFSEKGKKSNYKEFSFLFTWQFCVVKNRIGLLLNDISFFFNITLKFALFKLIFLTYKQQNKTNVQEPFILSPQHPGDPIVLETNRQQDAIRIYMNSTISGIPIGFWCMTMNTLFIWYSHVLWSCDFYNYSSWLATEYHHLSLTSSAIFDILIYIY